MTTEETISIQGVALNDSQGALVTSFGVATDPRIREMLSDAGWFREAVETRMRPVLLTDRDLIALTTEIAGGYLTILSDSPSEVVLSFVLNVPFAYDIFNHILSDPYDAMAVVDAKQKVAFISPVHEKFFGLQNGEGIGKKVRDVIENTRLHQVVRTGIAEVGQIQHMQGNERVVSRHPIRHNGKVVGAIGRVMFKGPQQLDAMSKRIRDLESEIAAYKNQSRQKIRGEEFLDMIIGQSLAMQSVREQIRKIAPLDIPVLIQGESGTGKELVAQALHMLSARQSGRLVTVNAAALPDSLVESELFGYEAGSFTGADRKGRPGKFEQADKGTIFLDEIGDMALDTQSKLLRVLQDRMVERVGGSTPKHVDFRLCSATNRDLETFVQEGRFRLDLFYRISPVVIALPSLGERLEDIPLLINHFAEDLAKQYNRVIPEIDPDVHSFLMEQDWPGNVRQLRHVMERAFVFCERGRLSVADFQSQTPGVKPAAAPAAELAAPQARTGSLKDSLDALEAKLIHDAIIRFKGNKKKAAEHLGVSRSYLYKKLETLREPSA
ncbi:sigma-54 interaction domain-containing protein [Celeribacter indicus]|uniref:Nif-specific regulatory protein n=1 Tax=Celeribacter indicus TaxID=1208324 RepID=A0A0B5E6X7_9RHOB|nr:sigma-54-dependent Fis family transcriptional regulator [Celeribacter indicus]AJE49190.1 sigma-54 dependent transcription regulator [Celeribacter indicus]SDX18455.1 PAS domain S-box-containing protein [Celeribacter indicus]